MFALYLAHANAHYPVGLKLTMTFHIPLSDYVRQHGLVVYPRLIVQKYEAEKQQRQPFADEGRRLQLRHAVYYLLDPAWAGLLATNNLVSY